VFQLLKVSGQGVRHDAQYQKLDVIAGNASHAFQADTLPLLTNIYVATHPIKAWKKAKASDFCCQQRLRSCGSLGTEEIHM